MFETLIDGLAFGEGPRWHEAEQRLYFSDMHAGQVLAVDGDGNVDVIAEVENDPSGLGWLPDGRLLIVSMQDRKLLVRDDYGTLSTHADLSDIATFHCNDMVVDGAGRAYVGNFGFDLHAGAKGSFATATLAIVEADGTVKAGPADMAFPNGAVITDDGKTLVVAETFAGHLTRFDIAPDGSLSNRRVWADLPKGVTPDGIAMDIAGDIWVTCPSTGNVYLVAEGGAVKETLTPSQNPFACMLGGPDGKTLFVLTAEDSHPDKAIVSRSGKLEVTRVAAGRGYAQP